FLAQGRCVCWLTPVSAAAMRRYGFGLHRLYLVVSGVGTSVRVLYTTPIDIMFVLGLLPLLVKFAGECLHIRAAREFLSSPLSHMAWIIWCQRRAHWEFTLLTSNLQHPTLDFHLNQSTANLHQHNTQTSNLSHLTSHFHHQSTSS
ncbi:unnamed protein product, partial [Prorocentrum cordatum]